ncbi:helix-turn-helix domain-containing protein [Salinibacter ruber]|uniref:helix-turn-helix domain-containing protein n=1 Tax=Salinibacter ruber TaxID=146919 RepID=UPI0021670E61
MSDEGIEVTGVTNPRESRSESGKDTGEVIGRKIASLRKEREKKQSELAEEIGKTNSWLSKVESGNVRYMVEDLISLADALDVPLRRLTPPSDSSQALADDFAESKNGATFLLKLTGDAVDVAVAGVAEEVDLQNQVREKIAQYVGRASARAVLKYFRLEQERIEELIRRYDYIRNGVEKGYAHVLDTCRRDGETILTVRISSPQEISIDQERTVTISLEPNDKREEPRSS